MSVTKARPGYNEGGVKGGDASGGDGFGNEIERMLMDRPMTRQSLPGGPPAPMSSGQPNNTLDELMAELGMLRGERGELSLPDRQLGRNVTRTGPPRMSATGDSSLLGGGAGGGADGILRPSTPRTAAAAAAAAVASPLVLPPAKGAAPVPGPFPGGLAAVGPSGVGSMGPGRSQSPMSARRSITGTLGGGPLAGTASPGAQGSSGPGGPPSGVLERQAQLETRLEKMELREQQLMGLISQLQQQVSTLSKAQQATQQQLAIVASTPPPPPQPPSPPPSVAAAPPPPLANGRQPSPNGGAGAGAPPTPTPTPRPHISDEEFIKNDDGESPTGSPRQRSVAAAAAGSPGPQSHQQHQQQLLQQQHSQRLAAGMSSPPGGMAPVVSGEGRSNKLVPSARVPQEWELDTSQLRKELGALAANVVRLRDQLSTLVPGGPAPLSEEVAAQAQAAAQLKHNLTQIAQDVVSLHKGLTSLKQNTERTHASLDKSINELQLQIQTNALNMFASGGPAPGTPGGLGGGQSNAVATALAATGGMTGSLEESLRSAFAKPAVRSLPVFNTADIGFLPDNAGAAAAVSAFGALGAAGGGGVGGCGGRRDQMPMANGGGGGGGLGAALALLNSFEEQAAAEQAEQQKAAIIAKQAVSIVDAKVKQVIVHVDRHMQMISSDVEERLRMYEQTIIRMAQQIDRVQRVLKDMEGCGMSRIVVRQGAKGLDDETAVGEGASSGCQHREKEEQQLEAAPMVKENWVKVAAMANGRFIPQKPDEKKPATKNTAHGYFRAPA